jgi:hypothetical protein
MASGFARKAGPAGEGKNASTKFAKAFKIMPKGPIYISGFGLLQFLNRKKGLIIRVIIP